MPAPKKFKPKNLELYVELKPGIYARKDRTKNVVKVKKGKAKEILLKK